MIILTNGESYHNICQLNPILYLVVCWIHLIHHGMVCWIHLQHTHSCQYSFSEM